MTMTIEIIIEGTTKTISKQELFGLVTSGKISADTPVSVNGKLVTVEMAFAMDSNGSTRQQSNYARTSTSAGIEEPNLWIYTGGLFLAILVIIVAMFTLSKGIIQLITLSHFRRKIPPVLTKNALNLGTKM